MTLKLANLEKLLETDFQYKKYQLLEKDFFENGKLDDLIELNFNRANEALERAYSLAYQQLKDNFEDGEGNLMMGKVQSYLSSNNKALYAFKVALNTFPRIKNITSRINELSGLESKSFNYHLKGSDKNIFIKFKDVHEAIEIIKSDYEVIQITENEDEDLNGSVLISIIDRSLQNINAIFLLKKDQDKLEVQDYFFVGKCNRMLNNFEVSYLSLKYYIQRNCNDLDALYELGLLFNSLNQFEQSLNYFKQIAFINPDFKDVLKAVKRTAKPSAHRPPPCSRPRRPPAQSLPASPAPWRWCRPREPVAPPLPCPFRA